MKIKTKIILIAAAPLIVTFALSGQYLLEQKKTLDTIGIIKANVVMMEAAANAMAELQKERGLSAVYVSGGNNLDQVKNQRQRADEQVKILRETLKHTKIKSKGVLTNARSALDTVASLRKKVGSMASAKEVLGGYTAVIQRIQDLNTAAIKAKTSFGVGKKMANIVILLTAQESGGLFRGTTSSLIERNTPLESDEFSRVLGLYSNVKTLLELPTLSLGEKSKEILRDLRGGSSWKRMEEMFQVVIRLSSEGTYGLSSQEFFSVSTDVIQKINAISKSEISVVAARISEVSQQVVGRIWLTVIIGFVFLAGLTIWITILIRSITAPLSQIIGQLDSSADQTSKAVDQVSAASQALAEGASQQAASLEETSSSLEEMSSMAKRNSENSQSAKSLAEETRRTVEEGSSDMQEMNEAMEKIKTSSSDISNIIKTIDEIAFQTNILALNAAVEAARAGEAGMGFAVVADEVRALAQRSAQAAHETADKIQDAINKSEQGVQISEKMGARLQQIIEKTRKVDDLVAEITTASNEQNQGIDQLNSTVSQMDQVTQANAASAEETASVAQELNAQTQELKSAVHTLVLMNQGRKNHHGANGGWLSAPRQALSAPRSPLAIESGEKNIF